MKIFETRHEKKQYWLVFDDNNEVVGKFESKEMAYEWMNQQIEQNKQAQNA